VEVGLLVDAEVDLAALDVADGLGDVGGDGAGLRVATAASKSRNPPWMRSMRSSAPTTSAPAASASAAFSPVAKTMTRAVLPVPCGRLTVPRTIWSALRGSTPRRMATSTVASYFVVEVSLASLTAWRGL
jgi:pyruvate/2-oxoglutarate dehydrogenase complex dihydrolipoamide acyltransferase (E2) component